MMSDPLKTIKRIVSQKVPDTPKDLHGYLIRDVKRVVGITVTVESRGHPQEPLGSHIAWLDSHEQYTPEIEKALKKNQSVTADITKINNRWRVLEFHINTPKKLTMEEEYQELLKQKEMYEAYANY